MKRFAILLSLVFAALVFTPAGAQAKDKHKHHHHDDHDRYRGHYDRGCRDDHRYYNYGRSYCPPPYYGRSYCPPAYYGRSYYRPAYYGPYYRGYYPYRPGVRVVFGF